MGRWGIVDDPSDLRVIEWQVAVSFRRTQWARVAKQRLGSGLENGGCTEHIRTLVRKLRREGKLQEAQLLVVVAVGGLWFASRLHEEGYSTSPLCELCGLQNDDEYHRVLGEMSNNCGGEHSRGYKHQPLSESR